MSASDQADDTLAAARAEVERAREELGETVEALAYKADVKARAHDKADELKGKAQETAHQVQAKARDAAQKLQAKAQEAAAEAQSRAGSLAQPTAVAPPPRTPQEEVQGRPRGGAQVALARVRQVPPPALAGIAAGAAMLVALVLARRRR